LTRCGAGESAAAFDKEETVPEGRGKKYREMRSRIDRAKLYVLEEGVKLARASGFAKFDESIDVAVRLGVNPKNSDQMVRGTVILPSGTGRVVRVAVFAKGEKLQEAKDGGADVVGGDDLIEQVLGGFMDFDKAVATPDMMAKVGKLGKILGRRGLMPNPKLGTVTFDVAGAVREAKSGKIEFKVEKAGIVHACVGRKSFTDEQLVANVNALLETIIKIRPPTVKGTYIRAVVVSTTMGPGVKIDVNELMARYK
jgi:large subunit ribosomal protein L1